MTLRHCPYGDMLAAADCDREAYIIVVVECFALGIYQLACFTAQYLKPCKPCYCFLIELGSISAHVSIFIDCLIYRLQKTLALFVVQSRHEVIAFDITDDARFCGKDNVIVFTFF